MARAMADWPAGNQDSAALIITGDSPPSPNRLTPLYLHNTHIPLLLLYLHCAGRVRKVSVLPKQYSKDSISVELFRIYMAFGESLKVLLPVSAKVKDGQRDGRN